MKQHFNSAHQKKQFRIIHRSIRSSKSLRSTRVKSSNLENIVSSSVPESILSGNSQNVKQKNEPLSTSDKQNLSPSRISMKRNTIRPHPEALFRIKRRRLSQINTQKKSRCFISKYCPCFCSRLCVFISIVSAIILAILVAAVTLALLSKNQTTTTTLVTTATTTVGVLSIGSNDTLQGIWNTVSGGDSMLATPGNSRGNYVATEGPSNAFDGNCSTKFLSFGNCTVNATTCGTNTGFYVVLANGAIVMKNLRFCTANDIPQGDPITITLEGTNQTGSALQLGSYGLDTDPGRNQYGQLISFSYNMISYLAYRILISSKRGFSTSVQYGEMKLFAS